MTKIKILLLICCIQIAKHANASKLMSQDAFIMLNTVGFLSGAADACKVTPSLANILNSGISLAINGGRYGDPASAFVILNSARQEGISTVVAGKADCSKVENKIRDLIRALK